MPGKERKGRRKGEKSRRGKKKEEKEKGIENDQKESGERTGGGNNTEAEMKKEERRGEKKGGGKKEKQWRKKKHGNPSIFFARAFFSSSLFRRKQRDSSSHFPASKSCPGVLRPGYGGGGQSGANKTVKLTNSVGDKGCDKGGGMALFVPAACMHACMQARRAASGRRCVYHPHGGRMRVD